MKIHRLSPAASALLAAFLMLLTLTACQGAAATTAVPALPPTGTPEAAPSATLPEKPAPTKAALPAIAETAAYPYPVGAPTATLAPDSAASVYPYPAGPSTGPAAPNRSKVTARLISQSADATASGTTVLHAQILTTEEIPGSPSFTKNLVNQVTDLYAETASLPSLQPGDTFSAEAVYTGDQTGGKFTVEKVQKIP